MPSYTAVSSIICTVVFRYMAKKITALKQQIKNKNRDSIFLDDESGMLFGYVEIEDEDQWNAIANTAICRKWWAYMKDIMPSNPDDSPVSVELRRVFHIDTFGTP